MLYPVQGFYLDEPQIGLGSLPRTFLRTLSSAMPRTPTQMRRTDSYSRKYSEDDGYNKNVEWLVHDKGELLLKDIDAGFCAEDREKGGNGECRWFNLFRSPASG